MPLPQHALRPPGILENAIPGSGQRPAFLPWTGNLWFRLDVSQYYVIRTIIILDVPVEGMGSLHFQG